MPLDPDLKNKIMADVEGRLNEWKRRSDWRNIQEGNLEHKIRAAGEARTQYDLYSKGIKEIIPILDNSSIQFGPEHRNLITAAIGQDKMAQQGLDELMAAEKQRTKQNTQLQEFRNKFETQEFGSPGTSLQEALSSNKGDIGTLNQFLGQQEAATFNTQLKPLIQMALGAKGLSDSGAQVELQSKALGQLQQAREANIMQAALDARAQAQGLERADVLGDVGYQQQMLTNLSDIQRSSITMQFQRELEAQRENLARQLTQRQGGSGMNWGAIGGMALGGALGSLGGPAGMMAGAGLGASLGGGLYTMGQGNYGGNQQLGNGFFAASQMMPNSWSRQQRNSMSQQSNVGPWQSPIGPYRNNYQYAPVLGGVL